jgi:hypothetical protein
LILWWLYDALFPVAFCLLPALIPAVIALGLWTLDSAARIAGMLFALIHVLITVAWMSRLPEAKWFFPSLRIALDCLILTSLLRSAVSSCIPMAINQARFARLSDGSHPKT